MKYHVLTAFILFTSLLADAQAGMWTWMKGDSTYNSSGNYGIQGIAAASNNPPGLYAPTGWTDHDGNFWIFGGAYRDGALWKRFGDLWKYDPSTNMWTWMKGPGSVNSSGVFGIQGIPSPFNYPSSRSSGGAGWTDVNGDLWMYGGLGYDAFGTQDMLGDLWRYTIATNEWTWMGGDNTVLAMAVHDDYQNYNSINYPGSTYEATANWVDQTGKFWFFGAYDYDYILSDDMWSYDASTNEWGWMRGFGPSGLFPVDYGIQGVPAFSNTPGSRFVYSHWIDSAGSFWMFGGALSDNYQLNVCNDLWRFDPSSLMWTWMGGTQVLSSSANVTATCISDTSFYPSGRTENRACWIDDENKLWTFGGGKETFDSIYNDLWVFDPNTGKWTWVNGNITVNDEGFFGTQGVASPFNIPPAVLGVASFKDTACNFWFFGGLSGVPGQYQNYSNALWRYTPDPNCPVQTLLCQTSSFVSSLFQASDTMICEKFCIDYFDSSLNNPVSWQWIFEGGLPGTSPDQNPSGICYDNPGVFDVTLITIDAGGNTDTLTLSDYITVYTNPFAPTITQTGNTLTSSPADSYQWLLNGVEIPGATNQSYEITQSGLYTVVIEDANECTAQSDIKATLVGVDEIFSGSIAIYPNPSSGSFIIEHQGDLNELISIQVINSLGQIVFRSEEDVKDKPWKKEIDLAFAANGIYQVELKAEHSVIRHKLIVTQ